MIGLLIIVALWLMILRFKLERRCECGGYFRRHHDYGDEFCDGCGRRRWP
jgi:hypothetical protein